MDKYSELKGSFNNFANNINNFTNNIDNLTEHIMDTIDNYKDHMNEQLKRIEADSKPNGIVIDHTTFSKLINTLSYGVSVGTVDKTFYDEMIKLGMKQTEAKKVQSKEYEMPAMIAIDKNGNPVDINKYIMEIFNHISNRK